MTMRTWGVWVGVVGLTLAARAATGAGSACRDLCGAASSAGAQALDCVETHWAVTGSRAEERSDCLELTSRAACGACLARLGVADRTCSVAHRSCFEDATLRVGGGRVRVDGGRSGGASQVTIDDGGVQVDAPGPGRVTVGPSGVTLQPAREPVRGAAHTRAAAGAVPAGLTLATPVTCAANDEVVLTRKAIRSAGSGVVARGNCHVVIRGSDIDADAFGIEAWGNAEIEIEDSVVQGAQGALLLMGNTSVGAGTSVLRGGIQRPSEQAEFADRGGNRLERQP